MFSCLWIIEKMEGKNKHESCFHKWGAYDGHLGKSIMKIFLFFFFSIVHEEWYLRKHVTVKSIVWVVFSFSLLFCIALRQIKTLSMASQ